LLASLSVACSAVSVGSHYREIRKQINPFLKKT